jgi:hypothetical protein
VASGARDLQGQKRPFFPTFLDDLLCEINKITRTSLISTLEGVFCAVISQQIESVCGMVAEKNHNFFPWSIYVLRSNEHKKIVGVVVSDISTAKRDSNPASTQASLYGTGSFDVLTPTLGRLHAGHECG